MTRPVDKPTSACHMHTSPYPSPSSTHRPRGSPLFSDRVFFPAHTVGGTARRVHRPYTSRLLALRHPQYHRRSHPSRAKPVPTCRPIFPTHVRKGHVLIISSTRTHPTVTRNTTDALTPHEPSPSPHRGRSLPRTSARVHVPCVCRASRQHQLRAIDRSARRTRCSSVDGGRAREI